MRHSTFPRSGVLLLGSNSIQSLLPSTLLSQVESLLESHRIHDAVSLADQHLKKVEGKLAVNNDESEELHYVYQRIGFQCLSETLFEDAGKHLFTGNLDPRVLVSYFPDLRGSLFNPTDTIDVYAGVAEHMPSEASIDNIIVANLVRNYSPYLSPSTLTAPQTVELRKVLGIAAREMLEKFLRKWRIKRVADGRDGDHVDEVVDTVIAKIFAEEGQMSDLYTLLESSNYIVLSELGPVLKRTKRYHALCLTYRQRGADNKLLDAWSRLIDGEWTDEDVKDPLSSMFTLLSEKRDRKLTQQWGIWLIKRDPERALKLLTSRDTGKRRDKPEEDLAMLQQIRDVNPAAGTQFLEHLVLQKQSANPDLHMQLAISCADQLITCLADEATAKLWRAKASSYASSRNDASFISYFASTTPDSEHKRIRLKTALFLQGSMLYKPDLILPKLLEHQKILKLEIAIVQGKLGDHRAALSILVHDLHDATSAEAYCALGGSVVPGKTAHAIGAKNNLQLWSSALYAPPIAMTRSTSATLPMERQASIDESVKKGLLNVLLEVYMNDGELERTSHLLNSQAMNLDALDVIPLVPPDWPLTVMTTFLTRSFRRTLHEQHEGQIIKAISSGQNLQVADSAWVILREEGAIIEEADDDDANDGTEETFDEKDALAEKIGLHLQDISANFDEAGGEIRTKHADRLGYSESDSPRLM